ncbi:MAG TPA: type IX secretion system membrane protein PorP/SprF [Prolixibacteraceae bacterium]|nr:type IX secretion system membrane protein PorP/SprF [Prolixibacteraceae bacterium]
MKGIKYISSICTAVIIMLFIVTGTKTGYAQQDPVYTQYMNNLMSVNPAYTGVRGVGSISGIFRQQWLNLKGAPTTSSLTLSMPLDSLHVGGGMDFLHDNFGHFSTTALFLDYSYRIRATQTTQISFGLKAGFNYVQSRLTEIDRYHYDDAYILEYGDYTRFLPNFGVGIFWYGEDFYAGFAVPRLLQNEYTKDEVSVQAASREQRHYFLHSAYMLQLSPTTVFKPGLTTMITAGAPVTADFDFSFLFLDRFWVGAMYRISDAIGAYAHVQLNQNLKIGFAYDYTHTRLKSSNDGTFEVMLRYDFKTKGTQVFPHLGF